MSRAEHEASGTPATDSNHVVLSGRVSIPPDERRLPSGDVLVSTRVVVERDPGRGRIGLARSKQRVDAIDCVAWTARLQRVVRRWQPGDRVYVEGCLRRRFFRTDKGPISRFEVELTSARLVSSGERLPARPLAVVEGDAG